MAPLYDLVPIRLDRHFTHQLAYNLGGTDHFDTTSATALVLFLQDCGVADIGQFENDFIISLVEQLEAATPSLRSQGFKDFDDLIGREPIGSHPC